MTDPEPPGKSISFCLFQRRLKAVVFRNTLELLAERSFTGQE